jgi:hypothetical protein
VSALPLLDACEIPPTVSDEEISRFVEHLKHWSSATRPRTARAMESEYGWPERACREWANKSNERGEPIASGNDGYFYATAFEDFDPMLSRLRHQRDKMHERILAIERLRAKRFGPPMEKVHAD